MIRPTFLFSIRHPYLSVLILLSNVVVAVLLLWGWTELRFSPLQRHYLPYYFGASNSEIVGDRVGHVEWIEKIAPGRQPETAQLDDVFSSPADTRGGLPFRLSQAAVDQGWMGLEKSSHGGYEARELRGFLEDNFFGGRSFLVLFLQPFEIVLIGYLVKKAFDTWREDLARDRGASWNPDYRATTWDQDLSLLVRITSRGTKAGVVQGWRWVKVQQQNVVGRRAAAAALPIRVSPAPAQPATPERAVPRPKKPVPVVATVVEIVTTGSSGPAVSEAKPKPVAAAVVAKPAPEVSKSPFGQPTAEGEPERKWDLSQWID